MFLDFPVLVDLLLTWSWPRKLLIITQVRLQRKFSISTFIIQHIVTLPKYGHDALNIPRPQSTDILRYM